MLLLYLSGLSVLSCIACSLQVSFYLGTGLCLCLSSDCSSIAFIFTLCTVSFSVCVWSYYYCEAESAYRRFLGLIFCFVASIFLLVFGSNLLLLMVA